MLLLFWCVPQSAQWIDVFVYLPWVATISYAVRHSAHDAKGSSVCVGNWRIAGLDLQSWHVMARSGFVLARWSGMSNSRYLVRVSVMRHRGFGLDRPSEFGFVRVAKVVCLRKAVDVWCFAFCTLRGIWFVGRGWREGLVAGWQAGSGSSPSWMSSYPSTMAGMSRALGNTIGGVASLDSFQASWNVTIRSCVRFPSWWAQWAGFACVAVYVCFIWGGSTPAAVLSSVRGSLVGRSDAVSSRQKGCMGACGAVDGSRKLSWAVRSVGDHEARSVEQEPGGVWRLSAHQRPRVCRPMASPCAGLCVFPGDNGYCIFVWFSAEVGAESLRDLVWDEAKRFRCKHDEAPGNGARIDFLPP